MFVCLFVWFLNVLVNYWVISRTGPKTERLTILRAATHDTELGDHDLTDGQVHSSIMLTLLGDTLTVSSKYNVNYRKPNIILSTEGDRLTGPSKYNVNSMK